MIKSSELRIGNIVKSKVFDKIVYVEEIHRLFIETNYSPIGYLEYDKIEPIKLTEEIFLKLGMTKNHFRPERFDFEGVENGQFHIDRLNGRFVFRGLGMTIVYVDYLHDLQNLHFACKRTELNTSGL